MLGGDYWPQLGETCRTDSTFSVWPPEALLPDALLPDALPVAPAPVEPVLDPLELPPSTRPRISTLLLT